MGETKLLNSVSLEFIEALYADYLRDPESVPPDWRQYFQGLSEGNGFSKGQTLAPTFKSGSIFNPSAVAGNGTAFAIRTAARSACSTCTLTTVSSVTGCRKEWKARVIG